MSDKYLRCETLTGEWWYKDMETGEDLPMYATPIERKSWQDLNNECSKLNLICKQLKSQLQQKENIIKEVREYIVKHCVNEKVSKEVGFNCYTMADTNELEYIMKKLGDDDE